MNTYKQKILERAGTYAEFKKVSEIGLERLREVLTRLSEVSPEADVSIVAGNDGSLRFKILGFSAYVRFLINVTRDIGTVQWYYISFDPKRQKDQAELALEYYFDHLGNIYGKPADTNAMYGLKSDFWSFVYQNILEFCEKVDQKNLKTK
jgi:hypothetical protein